MNSLCEQCAFWDMYALRPTHGSCRKYPPRVVNSEQGTFTEWPTTEKDDWCGEFQEMKEVE